MKYRLSYQKNGPMAYVSHLDLVRLFGRAFRRAQIPVEQTAGFHPHPKMVFGPPLPLFVTSSCEILDFSSPLEGEESILSALQDALPDGIVPNSVTMRPGAAAVEPYALYAIEYCCPSDICALQDEYEAAPMVYEKRSKKGVSSMKDLKSLAPFVQFGSSEGKTQVRALLSAKADSYASPLAFASLLSSSLPSLSGGGQPSVRKLAAGERMAFCGGASFFEA